MEKISEKMLEVIKIIHKRGGVASAHEIYKDSKEKSKIAYVTIQKYLKELIDRKLVIEIIDDKNPEGKVKRYSIDYNYVHQMEDE